MADPRTDAEQALRSGDPRTALARLTEAVRAKPADAALRIFLAQLLCVLGQWERAHTQLNVVADLDKLAIPMRETVGHAIRCELMRAQVFAGKRTPMVFGQPDEWLALLVESLLRKGQGDEALSQDLAARAFDAAPAVGGRIDGTPFEWIMDADSRLGPVLEACVNGNYYWVPFARLAKVTLEAPEDLRDCVWTPAQLTFANGGETVALVPTRYPGSQDSTDGLINLARKTEWVAIGPDRYAGLGQRVLATDAGEYDLMSVRVIELDEPPAEAGGEPDAGAA
jgi:type VI secretion system protein ImpE